MLCADYEAHIGSLNAELKDIEINIAHNRQAVESLKAEIQKVDTEVAEQEATQKDNKNSPLPQFFVHFSTNYELDKLEKKRATFKDALLLTQGKLNFYEDAKLTATAKREKLLKELEKVKNNVLEGPWTVKK